MFSGGFVAAAILFGWRVVKLLGPMMLRGHAGGVVEAISVVETGLATPRSYLDGLAWTMVAALLLIGVPLVFSDREFVAAHRHDVEALFNAVEAYLPRLTQLGWLS